MRIIAGKWRGRPLAVPPGRSTRPTSDRVREALFSMLTSRLGGFDDFRVADLYAGSGALGFEALSRGAQHVTFVENDSTAAANIRRNAEKFGASVEILITSAERLPVSDPFDVVFADPPYSADAGTRAVQSVLRSDWLAPDGWLCVETSRSDNVDGSSLELDTVREIGPAKITLLRRP